MTDRSTLPIGIFDSGIGGLTVFREIERLLPKERLIYVGDTARVPYGTKSPRTVRRYALQIAYYLLQKRVKCIVVACNTASSVALQTLKNLPIPVIGVIEPGARAAIMATKNDSIGVIGTPATVGSHSYRKAIRFYSHKARVMESACPLFVPLVEEGRLNDEIVEKVAQEYLKNLKRLRIDTLVLGCTHYPLLKDVIGRIMGPRVKLIDSAEETAKEVQLVLSKMGGLNNAKVKGSAIFYTTDEPKGFRHLAHHFLGQHLRLVKHLPLENI